MKMYTFTAKELTQDSNIIKDVLAHTLLTSGVINEDQYKIITEELAMIVAEKGFFGKTISKALNWTDENALYYKCVQVNNIKYNNKENTEDVHKPENGDQ